LLCSLIPRLNQAKRFNICELNREPQKVLHVIYKSVSCRSLHRIAERWPRNQMIGSGRYYKCSAEGRAFHTCFVEDNGLWLNLLVGGLCEIVRFKIRKQLYSWFRLLKCPKSACVTGFGCRPITTLSTRTTGRRSKAAGEGRRGEWGTQAQRALWRFGWHRWRSVGLVKQAAAPRMSADAGSWARPASAPRSCRGALGPCPTTDGRSTRASSSPAVSQQHERSAVTSKTVASIVMTYRS
jgi:hypothetical protein